jgi:hypothetical protein
VTIFLDYNPIPQLKNVSPSRIVVLNQVQGFILVTFKDHIPKDVMHELGGSHQTIDLSCQLYIRLTPDEVYFLLNYSRRAYQMESASSCL